MADATALPGRPLGDALRALPLESPDASAWPALAARLEQRARPRRWPRVAVLAAAASLLAALLLVPGVFAPANDPAGARAAELATLMDESAQLERVLAAARNDVAGNASALVFSLQLEDRLGAVDAELAQPGITDARRLALWRERVEVLHAAASLESSSRYYAAEGQALEPTLVATY